MDPVITLNGLSKTYDSGLVALQPIDLTINRGEIFALLGPNGAGKTTLINMVCGIVTPTSGQALINGHDVVRDYRAARASVGLVPQELATETFETPLVSTRYSRGLFGYPPDEAHLERLLRDLSLWEKADEKIQTLSGGMKRRVMIAKALAHEPGVLFLDEPTAGMTPEELNEMVAIIRKLREELGLTIFLIEHRMKVVMDLCEQIQTLVFGEVIAEGNSEEIMNNPQVIEAYLGKEVVI